MRALLQQGLDENKITSLELLVFDSKGLMVDYALATDLSKGSDGRYTFSARIKPHRQDCIIHYVANRHQSGWVSPWSKCYGLKESDVLLSDIVTMEEVMEQKTIPMWARVRYDKIEAGQNLGEVKLLRSMAKFVLENQSSKLTDITYTIYFSPNRGTVAPFDPTDVDVNTTNFDNAFRLDNRIPTEPKLWSEWVEDENSAWHQSGEAVYGFERHNKRPDPNRYHPCLIVRARYDGSGSYSYYKLDFVTGENRLERYDLLRNYLYKLTILDARAPGAGTVGLAAYGPAANNIAISEELQPFPSYSDGKGHLELETTNYIFTQGEESFTFPVNYFPNNSSTPQNDKLRIIGVRNPNQAIKGDKSSISIDASGRVTVLLNKPIRHRKLSSDIIVGVEGNPDLMRVVRVFVREPYSYDQFKANGITASDNRASVQISHQQGTLLTFEITIPDDFGDNRLPTHLRFFTEHFYPEATQSDPYVGSFAWGRKDGRTCYTMTLSQLPYSDKKVSCTFRSNKGASAETIKVVSVEKLFHTQYITISTQW